MSFTSPGTGRLAAAWAFQRALCLRLLVALVVLAAPCAAEPVAGPAAQLASDLLAGSPTAPPPGGLTATLDSLLAGPLAVASLHPADLGFRTDYEDPDAFRLMLIDQLLLSPRHTAEAVDSLAAAWTDGVGVEVALPRMARALAPSRRPASGWTNGFDDTRSEAVHDRVGKEWAFTDFASFLGALEAGIEAAFAALSPDERSDLLSEGVALLEMDEEEESLGIDELAALGEASEAGARRVLAAAESVAFEYLLKVAWDLAWLADEYSTEATGWAEEGPKIGRALKRWRDQPPAEGDVIGAYRMADGRPAVLGGPGPTRYLAPCAFIVDLGGDDTYLAGAGGNGGEPLSVALTIDLGGNDTYVADSPFGLAAGALGVGVLIDAAGDDVYRAGDFGLGAGFLGVGVLDDRGGNDRYVGGNFTCGAGAFGIGILRDRTGRDLYQGSIFTEGFGFVYGVGLLDDRQGEDVYLCQPRFSDLLRDSTTSLSMGQGFAFGYRPLASGGIGLLVDGGGHDRYLAEVFGQGGAYWCGLGGLVDRSGNDHYDGFNYVQGSGVHVAVAALIEGGGKDLYRAKGVAQGCGHDLALGILVDSEGDDRYDAADLSQGAGNANGVGLLIDLAGDDVMTVRSAANTQGYGNFRRNFGSVGVLVNAAGSDRYLGGGAADGELWQLGEHGVGVDAGRSVIAALAEFAPGGTFLSRWALANRGAPDRSPLAEPPPSVEPPALGPIEKPRTLPPADAVPDSFRTLSFARLFNRAAVGQPRFAAVRDAAQAEIVRRGAAVVPDLAARLGTLDARERHTIKDLALLLGPEKVERAFAEVLLGEDERAARAAAWCLERCEARGVERELARAAQHSSWRVRAASVTALGRGGGAESLPVLIAALGDAVGSVRKSAAQALGERLVILRRESRSLPSIPPVLVPALADALADPFYGCRHAAARALGRAGPLATASLLEIAGQADREAALFLAIDALGAGGDARARPALGALARSGHPAVAARAICALAEFGELVTPTAVPPVNGAGTAASDEAAALLVGEASERARARIGERAADIGERPPSP